MRARNLINITNHPQFSSITRKAQVRSSDNHYEAGTVTMVLNIYSYLNEIELKDMFKQIVMFCDNSMINPVTFEYVFANEAGEYPAGSVGEYDYLYDLVLNKTKTQFELEEMFITLRIPTINEKMYG